MSERSDAGGYDLVEYYPSLAHKAYVNQSIDGVHYRNSYYDDEKLYLSLSHTLLIYNNVTKQTKELKGFVSNAMKKINGEIWVGLDNGFGTDGYSGSLCKINFEVELDCLYELKNQRLDDFYINFEEQVFYVAGPGVGENDTEAEQQYKVMKYDMHTGEGIDIRNNGQQIIASRLTHICPGQFITSEADIYLETGEKIGEVIGTKGKKLKNQINDLVMNEVAFLDYENNLLEIYNCNKNTISHVRTIELAYVPDIYPEYRAWETTDDGEISMPIRSTEDSFLYPGFQSINLRTGEVQVHLFDEPVYRLHAVARFA
jgi:hypothetical protein